MKKTLTKCQCSPECTAVVKTKGKIYAQYHSPLMVWNRGLTKETNASIAKMAADKVGKSVNLPVTVRENKSRLMKEFWSDPTTKELLSNKAKGIWASRSLTERKRITSGMQTAPATQIARTSQANKKRLKAATIKNWADPEKRAQMTATRKEFGNTPEERERLSNIAQSTWDGPKGVEMRLERAMRWQDPKYRKRMMVAFVTKNQGKPAWNKGLNKDNDSRMQQLSLERKGQIPDRGFRIEYQGLGGKTINFRSSWEWVYANYLDEQGIQWEYEPFHFDVGAGAWRGTTITPDFFLLETQEFVDVKGYLGPEDAARIREFHKRCPLIKFSLFEESDFRAVGIDIGKLGRQIRDFVNQKILPFEGCPTPWGIAQSVVPQAEGIFAVETSSHGGFYLTPLRNQRIPIQFRSEDGWYEEDCNWCIPVVVFERELATNKYFAECIKTKQHTESFLSLFSEAELCRIQRRR